jgi:hypothetical protein
MATSFDWKRFEAVTGEAALAAVKKLMDQHAGSFYAAAFHAFYAETGSRIDLPLLAANTLEALAKDPSTKWNCADWRWDDLSYPQQELRPLLRALVREATSKDDAHWDAMHARYIQAFVNVAKDLRAKLRRHEHAASDFVVLLETEDTDEVDVLRKCVSAAEFKKLFPELEAERSREEELRKGSVEDKLRTYRQDLFKYQEEVLKLGEQAAPMLLETLGSKDGWLGAGLLAELGIGDPNTIAALRKYAVHGAPVPHGATYRFHYTAALAFLGDLDFVFSMLDQPETCAVAARGICCLYQGGVDKLRRPPPLDYGPLKRLLAKPECRSEVEQCLQPGVGYRTLTASDVEEALRGLDSEHAIIRFHAVCLLAEPRLGKLAGERILPALAARLRDRNATVRRLAVLSLHYWKKAAKPFAAEVHKLFKDPVKDVAVAARAYFPK